MKRLTTLASFPSRSSASALFVVSGRRGYTNAVSSALVPPLPPFMNEFMPKPSAEEPAYDINPNDWPNFNEEYEKLLKKFNAKDGTPEALSLFEATKAKLVTLEDVKTNYPEEYNKFKEGYEAVENELANYAPSIKASVDEAFDTKHHPFVTDPVGAYIFACASEYFDRKDFISKLQGDHLGLTPRRRADMLWAKVMASRVVVEEQVTLPAPRGDLPGWLVSVFDTFYAQAPEFKAAFPEPKNKAEALNLICPKGPMLNYSSAFVSRKGKELQHYRLDEIAKAEGLTPGSPVYTQVEKQLEEYTQETRPSYLETYEKAIASVNSRMEALAKRFEEDLLSKDTNEVAEEKWAHKNKYSGEHGVVRGGIRGFLLGKPKPTTEEKVAFMKELRKAVLQRRKASGIVPHELYPNVPDVRTPKNLSDEELAGKFDQIAADL